MKGLDATQTEQLKQIAEYLSYQRQEKEISLEKVAKQTFIPLRLLEALESMQVDRLPEPVYIHGFIRRYADALGLDGVEIAKAFPLQAMPVVETVSHTPVNPDPEPPVIRRSNVYGFEGSESLKTSSNSNLPLILSGVAAVVVVGAIALGALNLFKKAPTNPALSPEETSQDSLSPESSSQEKAPQKKVGQESPPQDNPSQDNASQENTAQSSSNGSTTEQPSALSTQQEGTASVPEEKPSALPTDGTSKSVQLAINLTGSSWVQVIVDGKSEFEGILKKGDQRAWSAEKDIVITAGEAGAVKASCNQSEAKPLGKPGEVVDSTCSTKKDSP